MTVARTVLSPDDASQVLEALRSEYGLGDKYRMDVAKRPNGRWRIQSRGKRVDSMPPMSADSIHDWFDKQFGDVITDRLETSEG